MDTSDRHWSNGIRYHIFGTSPDTKFITTLSLERRQPVEQHVVDPKALNPCLERRQLVKQYVVEEPLQSLHHAIV